MDQLYQSLNQRLRPEDVARHILDIRGDVFDQREQSLLHRAAKGSLKERLFGYTSMAQMFAQPVGLERQIRRAAQLFAAAPVIGLSECSNPEAVESFLREIGLEIRKTFGSSSFKQDRLNGEARAVAGLELSRRRYNKLFRLLTRMEDKLHTLVREMKKARLTKIGKSSLASLLSWEEFSVDADAACFIAYYTARANLRSEFTISGQQKAFDEIAEMLLARCRDKRSAANWFTIAHVYPSSEVLARLTQAQRGALLGQWFSVLQDAADLLKETWDRSDIQRASMIVQRGNDSTTWNNTASAWNKARGGWIGLVYALGMGEMLDALCPGKVLRLIAGDVAAWHRSAGHASDPDLNVWSDLPLPWEVLTGEQTCTRTAIEASCRLHGVDPVKSGWAAPRPPAEAASFRPTPELVHGVTVANPFFAVLLRKNGYFSGKPKPPLG